MTEFTDHICVTMDAELIMFLHDLVSAYLKEKEKGFLTSFMYNFHSSGLSVRRPAELSHFLYFTHIK